MAGWLTILVKSGHMLHAAEPQSSYGFQSVLPLAPVKICPLFQMWSLLARKGPRWRLGGCRLGLHNCRPQTSEWHHSGYIHLSYTVYETTEGLNFRRLSNQSSPLFHQTAAVIPSRMLVWALFKRFSNVQKSWSFTCRKQNLVESYDWWLHHLLQAEKNSPGC